MMSGTSVDGIDIAAIEIDGDDVKVLSTGHRDYDDALRTRILAAASGDATVAVAAFNTGPANVLSDLSSQQGGQRFDKDGSGAARGRVGERALGWAFGHEYFPKRAPKSTGREDFGKAFADELARRVTRNNGTRDDALATAIALTAR